MSALTDFSVTFEMATGDTPRTASPSYTDLTAYVMADEALTLTRGRGSEQSASAQAGRANVTLRNTDGRFTVGNGSSPYAPVQIRRPCRFRVSVAGSGASYFAPLSFGGGAFGAGAFGGGVYAAGTTTTTYDLWQGFVDDWVNGRDETTGVARLTMSDRIARAARVDLDDAVTGKLRSLGEAGCVVYPLGTSGADASGSSAGYPDLIETRVGDGGGTVTYGFELGLGPDAAAGVTIAQASSSSGVCLQNATDYPASSFTADTGSLSAFVAVNPASAAGRIVTLTNGSQYVSLLVSPSDLTGEINGGSYNQVTAQASLTDGNLHHIGCWWSTTSGTTTLTLFLDGVQVGTCTATSSTASLTTLRVGSSTVSVGPTTAGDVAMVAAYKANIGSVAMADIAGALTSWAGETTADRFERLCSTAGIPSTGYVVIGSTETPMSAQPTAGKSLLSALDEVATAEGGTLYVDPSGVITLATSRERYNTAVGVTLDATKAGQVDAETEIPTNDSALINDSSATRYGGGTFRTVDATSVATYDLHDESQTLFLSLDAHALNWTQWRVAQYADPSPRLDEVPVNVVAYANSGGSVAELLAADVGTKLRITNLPSDTAASGTLDLLIDGVRDVIGKHSWVRTFTTSPVGLNDTGWILGTDLLGVGTTLGY